MVVVVLFSLTLLLAVLASELADRSVLSTAVIFLLAGFLAHLFGFAPFPPKSEVVATLAGFALFAVLFTDGMRIGLRHLAQAWALPGRALLLGLPLTLLGTAALAHWVAGISWIGSFLIGAVLSPTDPVFAAAIVGREEIPARLRFVLNVESGLNDGIALPIVLALLAAAGAHTESTPILAGELALGIALGVAIPWLAAVVERSGISGVARSYQPLYAFAIGLLVYAVSKITTANEYLAAFAAGVTVASVSSELRDRFHDFGTTVAELLKLIALLVFGMLISIDFLRSISASGYLFALLALTVVRPVALLLALWGSELDWSERLTAAWFGPKGFASVVYGLIIVSAGVRDANEIFHLIALVIAASIVAHSSTDVVIARWFHRRQRDAGNRCLDPPKTVNNSLPANRG